MSENIQFAPPQELKITTSTETRKPSRMKKVIAAGAAVVTLAVGINVAASKFSDAVSLPGIPSIEKKTTEGLSTVIARELQKTREFRGSKKIYGITAELTKSERLLFLENKERNVISTTGSARGVIDLTGVNESNVMVAPDNSSVTIRLPHARAADISASHKPEEGMIIIEDKNLPCKADRCDYIDESTMLGLADRKLERAVDDDDELLPAAEQEAREFLSGFVNAFGVQLLRNQDPANAPDHINVIVTFGDDLPAPTTPPNAARY